MKIILSPAKKMNVDTDSFSPEALPQFLPETEKLLAALRALSPAGLQALWRCNDSIAALNVERLRNMDLERNLTPAVMSYEGIAYRFMAPGVMERRELRYLRDHLRILSGFYGLLRPFDGVTPYRLEMGAKLSVGGAKDLYAFWGGKLAAALAGETGTVLDLASKEYSRAVLPHLPPSVRVVTCVFGELKGDKVIEKGTLCKMARGEMVRWLAGGGITRPEEVRAFDRLGYVFSPERSNETTFVFLAEPKREGRDNKEWPDMDS